MNREIVCRANALLLLLVLLCCAGVASAQGWYMGAAAGLSMVDDAGCSHLGRVLDPGFSCNGSDASTGWKIFAGYELSRYLAVEGSYVDLGEFEVSASGNRLGSPPGNTMTAKGTNKLTGFGLDMVGTWPANEQWGVIGQAGIFLWTQDFVLTTASVFVGVPGGTESEKPTRTSLEFGVGVKYDITKNLAARVQLQRFAGIGNDTTGKLDANLVSFSLAYRFRSSFY